MPEELQRASLEPADREVSDDILDAMVDGGIEVLFFTSGSDIMFYQEAICKREALGLPAPRLVTMPHEYVNINAAMGYAAVSGTPVATAVHVDVGTLNYGAGLHNVSRSRLPIVLTAGTPATAMPGTMRGARDAGHFWTQQVPDQNGIARPYVKWEHRLEWQDNPGNVVGRAVQVAMSEPTGPVYLSLPREVAMQPSRDEPRVSLAELGVGTVGAPTRADVRETLDRILAADNPVFVTGRGGRRPEAREALSRLAETLAMTVVDGFPYSYQPLPSNHPHYLADGDLSTADVIIALETDVPWTPGVGDPPADAMVVVVDPDPIARHLPLMEFRASKRIASGTIEFCRALLEEADAVMAEDHRVRLGHRAVAIADSVRARRLRLERQALDRYRSDVIDPVWASYLVARALPEEALVLDDTVMSAPVRRYLGLGGPRECLRNPSTAGGWGPGASFGAKLAAPERFVCLVSGDGFYMYGSPTVAMWAARTYSAPFLSVVFQNDSYNTGTEETQSFYPDGFAAQAGFPGGYFPDPVDFAAEAVGVGAYGENVTAPEELEGALARGIAAVRAGRCAVIAIRLPRLLEMPPID